MTDKGGRRAAEEKCVQWLAKAIGVGLGFACAFAHAQPGGAYPQKPIRLISPFAPGGGASTIARMIAPELTEAWGQSVVVDNRPGAGGSIGTEVAARAPADGYTLLMATASTIVINPLVGKVPFDPVRDFAAVVH